MVSHEHMSREQAKLELEAKLREDAVNKELQLQSSELASARRALQEAKQLHVGAQDRADLLERSCLQLKSEYQNSEVALSELQQKHQTQQQQLQHLTAIASTGSSDRTEVLAIEQRALAELSEELELAHQKMKDEMVSHEHMSREQAKLELEAKLREDAVNKELQLQSSELASARRALQEAKQLHVVAQDRADLLERSCLQLKSEYQNSEVALSELQQKHQTQQQQLQHLTAIASTGSSDRTEVLAIEQRALAELSEELELAHQKMKDEMVSHEHMSREQAKLELEVKAQEDRARKELQLQSSELVSASRALQDAKQQSLSEQSEASSNSPVSLKDNDFSVTQGTPKESSGLAALRRARASIATSQSSPATPASAAQKLRAIAAAATPATPATSPLQSSTIDAPHVAKSPAVLAAHRAKAAMFWHARHRTWLICNENTSHGHTWTT
eukprot:Skav213978  [mRNA]  locus=scaffold2200:439937:442532:- [translate_table: standard]